MRSNFPQGVTSFGERGLNCRGELLPKCLKRKYKGQTLSKSNVLYTFRSSKILDIKNDHAFFI
jgi:hypothetical protein